MFSVPLTVYCFYAYGIRRVANVKEKGFHLPMFFLILTCSFMFVVAGAFLLGVGIEGIDDQYFKNPSYKVSVSALSIGWGLDYFLHTQFITKFWVLSRRVEAILLKKDNQ